jgi:hypothetical protein
MLSYRSRSTGDEEFETLMDDIEAELHALRRRNTLLEARATNGETIPVVAPS